MLEAFGAHLLKEISRYQLLSAAKSFLPAKERMSLFNADKMSIIHPLASAFVERNIIKMKSVAEREVISQGMLKKLE